MYYTYAIIFCSKQKFITEMELIKMKFQF